jgi:hypothetical protein
MTFIAAISSTLLRLGSGLLPKLTGLLALIFALSPVWADHGAPAPQLGGVTFCVAPSSVQLRLEGAALSPAADRQVREAILKNLRATLTAREVPFETGCDRAPGYVLLNLYARFLDSETYLYLGFPAASYTYVSSAQVGTFVADAGPDTALPEGRYAASASDIFQARSARALEARLLALADAQVQALATAWLEANAVPRRSYLLFAALALVLLTPRVVTFALSYPLRS